MMRICYANDVDDVLHPRNPLLTSLNVTERAWSKVLTNPENREISVVRPREWWLYHTGAYWNIVRSFRHHIRYLDDNYSEIDTFFKIILANAKWGDEWLYWWWRWAPADEKTNAYSANDIIWDIRCIGGLWNLCERLRAHKMTLLFPGQLFETPDNCQWAWWWNHWKRRLRKLTYILPFLNLNIQNS